MKPSRLLPPLVLAGVLGVIAWRAFEQPQREAVQRTIRARWEDPSAWETLLSEIQRYEAQYRSPDDLRFAAHAYLRARDPLKALHARWPDLDRDLPADEVKGFAEEALFVLGWDDETYRRPSRANPQVMMALIEGGNAQAREWLIERIRTEPIEWVNATMQRSMGLHGTDARAVVAATCRERAASERAAGRPRLDWDLMAAVLTTQTPPYPEWEADLAVLLDAVKGSFRTVARPRWNLACRALGQSGDPRGVAALQEVATLLADAQTEDDRRDLGVVQMSLLAAGDWSLEPAARALAQSPAPRLLSLRPLYQEVLLGRLRAGDPRARAALDALWDELGAQDATVRERLGRQQLLSARMPGPDVPVERMLQDLEALGSQPALQVVAKAFRVRRAEPGARMALVRWLADERVGDPREISNDAQRALNPLISALRALYLY